MRTACFDLETWDLSPQFGPILVGSVLDLSTGKMRSFRQDAYVKAKKAEDMTDDGAMCVDLRNHLEEFDLLVGWFSKGFDIAHLRTRLVLAGERPLHKHFHIDPCWCYKGWRGLKPKSASLDSVSSFFGFEEKPKVLPEVWMKAKAGNKKAMDEAVERCEADTRITATVYRKTLDLDLIQNISKY